MRQEKPDENGRTSSPGARSEAKTSVDDSAGGGADDRLVGRTEAAGRVGLSVATLRRLERTVLRPVVDGSGVHRHSVKRLLDYKADCASSGADVDGREGALAAAAFEHFDRSLGPADVVKLLKVAPSVARELHRGWADLGGGFVVSGEAAVKVERLALNDDDAPVRSASIFCVFSSASTSRSVLAASVEHLASASVASCTARRAHSRSRRRRSPGARRGSRPDTSRSSNGIWRSVREPALPAQTEIGIYVVMTSGQTRQTTRASSAPASSEDRDDPALAPCGPSGVPAATLAATRSTADGPRRAHCASTRASNACGLRGDLRGALQPVQHQRYLPRA